MRAVGLCRDDIESTRVVLEGSEDVVDEKAAQGET